MRYDILYTAHIPGVGEVRLYFDSIRVHGYHVYISGLDSDNAQIDLTLDRLIYPSSRPEDCGYCHIISYTIHGQTTTCNLYKSIK